jgi:hypothetical protein
MRVFVLAAMTAAVGIAIGLLLRTGVLHQGADRGIGASTRDPVDAEMHRLVNAARMRRPTGRRIRVLTQHVAGGTWHLAYSSNESRICWVVVVPRGPADGTCGAPNKIRSYPFVADGRELDTGGPNSHVVSVVYGWAWARVKVLRVLLSDCSRLHVNLSSRPIYWRFIPQAKLREQVRPTQVIGTLFSGKTEEALLGRGAHCRKRRVT